MTQTARCEALLHQTCKGHVISLQHTGPCQCPCHTETEEAKAA